MAKVKQQELTLEEKLEQALVPEDEWPYEAPGNWVWTRLGYLIEVSKEKCEDFSDAEQKYVGLEHMQKDSGIIGHDSSKGIKSLKNVFYSGEILYGKLRPYLNKHDIASFDGVCSTDILVFRPAQITDPKFVNYFFDTDNFIGYAVSNSKGINLPRVSESVILDAIIPLPPIAEQQRIVDRIETLSVNLDQAKELAQNALDTFETRKAAILHKAFTGELTAKWREKNGLGMESWEEKSLKQVAEFRTGYAFDSKSFANDGYQVIRMGNLYNGILDLTRNPVFILPGTLDDSIVLKYLIRTGDILLTLTGTKYKRDYGYTVLINEDGNMLLNQRIVSLTPKIVEPNLLLYYLRSDMFRDVFFSNETGGVNQGNVSSKFVENIVIPYPSLSEQQEIVRILDGLFKKEQRAKELCDVIDKIDLMKKAILARAFRGELKTNNPEEASAMELLKKILNEKFVNEEIKKINFITKIDVISQVEVKQNNILKVNNLAEKDMIKLLNDSNRNLSPVELYRKTNMDIDEFYAILKEYVDGGKIKEVRKANGEIYLEAQSEN
ncbi:MAG: restriction endonuclease subunit S [Bacillota bacterium]|nr:restriction endonuclease subunit S [Bacillota bacterium]